MFLFFNPQKEETVNLPKNKSPVLKKPEPEQELGLRLALRQLLSISLLPFLPYLLSVGLHLVLLVLSELRKGLK